MTRRFNLLPARYVARVEERRLATATAAALVVVVGMLALAGLAQSRALSRAEEQLDVERGRTAALTARRAELVRFRQLADGVTTRERLLAGAMGAQISWSSVLTGLGRALPADASLVTVTAESGLRAFGAPPLSSAGPPAVIGSTSLSGYSVRSFAPGVETVLQALAAVPGLFEPQLRLGTAEEIGAVPVTTFDGTVFVDSRALTGRYRDGLPPEDDIEIPTIAAGSPAAAAQPAAPAAGNGAR